MYVHTKIPAVRHTYYVVASVRVIEDYATKQVEVRASLGIAPDAWTVIEYPVRVSVYGYWNRTHVRKVAAEVKARLLEEMAKVGYTRKDLTEPLQVVLFWER